MSGADAVGARIAAANDEHILTFGCNVFILSELHTSQHTILLRKHLEGEMNTFEFAAWSLKITRRGSAG